jgi:hypothetical protein
MSDKLITSFVSIAIAIIGVAIIAVLVSKGANTGNVFTAAGTSISNILCTALSPVTGNSCGGGLTPNVTSSISYPGFPG